MIIHRRALFAGASSLLVAGCADVIGPPASPKLYVLSPKLAQMQGEMIKWGLAIQRPDTPGAFESDRIALSRPPAGMDFYADAAWSDRVPDLLQTALLEAFESSGRIASVARDRDGARSDLLLNSDVRAFEMRYDQGDGAPLAVIRMAFRVMESRARRILATQIIAKEARASANSIEAAVSAMSVAFSALVTDLVPWVLAQQPPASAPDKAR